MTNFNDLDAYASRWIGGEELGPRPRVVTISAAKVVEVGDDKKVEVTTRELEKPLKPLNRTQFGTLKGMFGTESKNWLGQKITVFGQKLQSGQFAGKWTYHIADAPDADEDVLAVSAPDSQTPMTEAQAIAHAHDVEQLNNYSNEPL